MTTSFTSDSNADRLEEECRDREEGRMTLVEHLAELRTRLMWSMGALGICMIFTFWQAPAIIEVLKRPIGDLLAQPGVNSSAPHITLQAIDPTENFGVYIQVALVAGLILSLPVHLYNIVMFINPGLLPNEKRLLYTFLPFATISFILGVAFAFFVVVPPAVQFLLGFGSNIAQPNIRISKYIDLVTRLLFWIGVVFEIPVFMLILARLGIIRYEMVSRLRRYAYVGAFIIGAIITPTPDPVNQTIVSVPLLVLFELGAQLTRIFGRK